jgi:hypothetical protein
MPTVYFGQADFSAERCLSAGNDYTCNVFFIKF